MNFLQFTRSNEKVVVLKNLDFEASGLYYCEVSTDSPIFTKASNEEQIHVIRKLHKFTAAVNTQFILFV